MTSIIIWKCNEDTERILWLKHQVFSNHLILERLVLAVHSKDLKAFRMVCRPWYVASMKRFERETTIVLHGCIPYYWENDSEEVIQTHRLEDGDLPKIGMHELSSELEKSRKVFGLEKKMNIQNCKIKYGLLWLYNERPHYRHGCTVWLDYPWGDFWKEFGTQIRHLTIEHCFLSHRLFSYLIRNNVETFVLICVSQVPTPNVLDYQLTRRHDDDDMSRPNVKRLVIYGNMFKHTISRYLSVCCNIKELDLATTACLTMTRDYAELTNPGTQYPIEVDAPIPFLPQRRSYAGLIALNYPMLESLSLHLEPDISDYNIKLVLETYADRLKTLKLSRYPFVNTPPFHSFPFTNTIFVGLTHLELTGIVTDNFNFLLVTPSLRTLVIDLLSYGKVPCIKYDDNYPVRHYKIYPHDNYADMLKNQELPGRVRSCSQLVSYYKPFSGNMVEASDTLGQTVPPFLHENLQHLEVDIEFDTASLSTLARWLPNINTMKTILTNDTLGCVCYHWPQLQHLKLLFGSAVDDNGLRGMHIKPSSSTKVKINCSDNLGSRLLVDMNNLHHFELENLCNTPQLTDVSAQHVFLKMAKLHFLIICSAQISELAIKNLEWTIPHVKIGSHASSNKLKCCGFTQFLRQIGRLSA